MDRNGRGQGPEAGLSAMKAAALILAAGRGLRLGGPAPKQYQAELISMRLMKPICDS